MISEAFEVLSVTVWLLGRAEGAAQLGRLDRAATRRGRRRQFPCGRVKRCRRRPAGEVLAFNLEEVDEPWAEECRQANRSRCAKGGHRWCVPLRAGREGLGAIVLADRVNGADYTLEELELLQCIAGQMTSGSWPCDWRTRWARRRRTGGVPDDVGVLRARFEERCRVRST